MAVNVYNVAEGGINGLTVTTGNSGGASGTSLSIVTPGTGTITYTNSISNTGNYSYQIVPGTGSACFIGLPLSGTIVSARAYVYLTAYPTTGTQFLRLFSAVTAADLAMNGSGKVFVQTNGVTADTGTTSMPLATWLRAELSVKIGTGTSDGYVSAAIYSGNDVTSPLYSYTDSTRDTGTTAMVSCSVGKVSASGNWATMYIDDMLAQDTLTPLGPVSTVPTSWMV